MREVFFDKERVVGDQLFEMQLQKLSSLLDRCTLARQLLENKVHTFPRFLIDRPFQDIPIFPADIDQDSVLLCKLEDALCQ